MEQCLNHNIILRKLKIVFDLYAEGILAILSLVGFRLSKHELSAFFHRADHKHYALQRVQGSGITQFLKWAED